MRVLNRDLTSPLRDIDLAMLLRPNFRGMFQRGITFPLRAAGMLRELASNLGEVSAVDLFTGMAAALPTGFYTGEGSSATCARCSPTRTARTTSGCSSRSST